MQSDHLQPSPHATHTHTLVALAAVGCNKSKMQHFSRAIFKFSTWRPAMPDAFYPGCSRPVPRSLAKWRLDDGSVDLVYSPPVPPCPTRASVCDVVASLRRCHIQSNSTACALTMCIRPALELAVPPCAVLQHGH